MKRPRILARRRGTRLPPSSLPQGTKERAYRFRGLGPDGKDQVRASLLAREGIAAVRFKPVESDTWEMVVVATEGTGWVPGLEGLLRSLGGEVLPDPRGA